MIKSDIFISDELQEAWRKAFKRLQQDQGDESDWHPGSRDMVDPSMYPLVYGQTKVFRDEVVGVTGAISQWAGKGDRVPKQRESAADRYERDGWPDWTRRLRPRIPRSYWSDTYQCLPSNIGFRADGSVIFKSYINNLHPEKYPEIYSTVEKLVDKALVTWDNCLIETEGSATCGPGRRKSRFSTPKNAQYVLFPPCPTYTASDYQRLDRWWNSTDRKSVTGICPIGTHQICRKWIMSRLTLVKMGDSIGLRTDWKGNGGSYAHLCLGTRSLFRKPTMTHLVSSIYKTSFGPAIEAIHL